MKLLGALIALLLSVVTAQAQYAITGTRPGYTGTTAAIAANGWSMQINPQLFAADSASLRFQQPFSIAFWVKTSAFSTSTIYLID